MTEQEAMEWADRIWTELGDARGMSHRECVSTLAAVKLDAERWRAVEPALMRFRDWYGANGAKVFGPPPSRTEAHYHTGPIIPGGTA